MYSEKYGYIFLYDILKLHFIGNDLDLFKCGQHLNFYVQLIYKNIRDQKDSK